MWMDS